MKVVEEVMVEEEDEEVEAKLVSLWRWRKWRIRRWRRMGIRKWRRERRKIRWRRRRIRKWSQSC